MLRTHHRVLFPFNTAYVTVVCLMNAVAYIITSAHAVNWYAHDTNDTVKVDTSLGVNRQIEYAVQGQRSSHSRRELLLQSKCSDGTYEVVRKHLMI